MKNHLSIKLAVILIGMTASIVLLSWGINTIFLEKFYKNEKIDTLVSTYNYIDEEIESKKGIDKRMLVGRLEKDNISMLVIDNSLNVVLSSGFSVAGDNLMQRMKDIIFDQKREVGNIESNEQYSIYTIYDSMSKGEYIELYGTLSSGNLILMRASVASIKENIDVSNRFFIFVGIGIICIGLVFIIIIVFRVAYPIQYLADIAKRMSTLDFTVKYVGRSKDEIGCLGESMNNMSRTLESTIHDLKQTNIELQNELKKKVEIDTMRKEFISNVSHELKTPIAIISGYAEGLKEAVNDDPESMNFYCDVITDEASKMNKMVLKLLTLNQMESGNINVDIEHFDLVGMIKQILSSFKVLLDERKIKIVLDMPETAYVWTDDSMMTEVITNYISNAINHIDGDKIIGISLKSLDDKFILKIRNTGMNIPEDEMDKIWTKFYKVDKARTREYGGSGIGLSIVKAIADTLNEKCGVCNFEDGVEFFFTLNNTIS